MMTPTEFFHEHSGWSFDPKTETREQGRLRNAKALAKAEEWAFIHAYAFQWELDGMDSSEWSDDVRPTWSCIMRDSDGIVAQSLCGIDFASNEPWGEPYRRVIEAELALEAMND